MPRGNGTGPIGMGPMTGRGVGYCADYEMPGFSNCSGVEFGRGIGRGRRLRRISCLSGAPGYAANTYNRPFCNGEVYDEKSVLKKQEEFLETQLKQVKDRLKSFDEEK